MKLRDYIDKKHGGNMSDFARTHGVTPHLASRWVKFGHVVYDGAVWSKRIDLKVKRLKT